jgi:hypothetical protein
LACLSLSSLAQEEEGELITGKQFPDGFGVERSSLSPDKRYGVLAPDLDHYDDAATDQNKLVEVKSGRVLAVIQAETGMVHMNHAYPDGFTVNVTDSDQGDAPLSLPLAISTALESDPKAIEDFPEKAKLNSEMDAIVDPDGKFVVKNFHLE